MNRKIYEVYNVRNVHIVNLIAICLVAVISTLTAFISYGWSEGINLLIMSILLCIIIAVVFTVPILDHIKAMIFSSTPAFVAAFQFCTNRPFQQVNYYLIILSMTMITLYFDKKLVIGLGAIINILAVIMAGFEKQNLYLEQNVNMVTIFEVFLYMNGIFCMLFILTKYGAILLEDSIEKENKIAVLYEEIESIKGEVNKKSNNIEEEADSIKEILDTVKKGNDEIISISNLLEETSKLSEDIKTLIKKIS